MFFTIGVAFACASVISFLNAVIIQFCKPDPLMQAEVNLACKTIYIATRFPVDGWKLETRLNMSISCLHSLPGVSSAQWVW